MMDTQRLIALVVFSFSALLLWEAWQKHNAPKVAHPAATTIPATPSHGAGTATTPAANATAAPTPGAPQMPAATPTVPTGEPVIVHTDLFDVAISPVGGDVQRITLQKVHSALDRTKPLTLMEPDPQHYFVTQTGLLGEGLPNHKTVYQPEQRSYTMPPGADTLEVRLRATAANGVEVVKKLTFHRDDYVIGVAYEIANKSDKPITPWGYFQFLRDANPPTQEAAQTSSFAGVTTFTGPALYTDEAKFTKVDFKDVEKGKPIPVKVAKYRDFARTRPATHHGFKLFYHEDPVLMRPGQVLRMRPRPELVVYE
jgi:YidC/Oxa1 family membrane protein insertase